jgi:hypothetical protein
VTVRAHTTTNPHGIKLGDRVRDRISGLTGIVTGFHTYLYGCERASITPEEHKDGKPAESFVVDAAQCVLEKATAVAGYAPQDLSAERPAGPRNDPARPSAPRR